MGSSIATARLQTLTATGWAPVGAGPGAASLPVALSGAAFSSGGILRAAAYSTGAGTVTAVITTASSPIMSTNLTRTGVTIYNEPTSTGTVLVAFAATASLTAYVVQVPPGGYYETPYGYTGVITGICASGSATLRATELA